MLRILLLVAVVGALVVVGAGRVDAFRPALSVLRTDWFGDAIRDVEADKKEWRAFAEQANHSCAAPGQDVLVLGPAFPRHRARFLRGLGMAIERERMNLAALTTLHAPSKYAAAYSKSLDARQRALSALERLQKAVKAKDRREFVVARSAVIPAQAAINVYVRSAGMPACAFL